MGRKKKKPEFNPEAIYEEMVRTVVECYYDCGLEECSSDVYAWSGWNLEHGGERPHRTISQVAEELGMTRLKVRKILISAGVFVSEKAELVNEMFEKGMSVEEIQAMTGMSRASVHSYLPYGKGIYKMEECSVGAERVRRFRKSCKKDS